MASLETGRTLFDKKSGAFTSRLGPKEARNHPGYREVAFPIPTGKQPLRERSCEPLEVVSGNQHVEMFLQGRTPIKPTENPLDTVGMREKAAERGRALEDDIDALFKRLGIPRNIQEIMQEGGLTPLQAQLKAYTHAEITKPPPKRQLPNTIPQGKTGS